MRMAMVCAATVLMVGVSGALAQNRAAATDEAPTLQHIDVLNVDRSVNPCDNFFKYTCDKVFAANPIPADQVGWGNAAMLSAWNRAVLRKILQTSEAGGAKRTANEQKIGDYYHACLQQAESKENDVSKIQPLLAKIDGMRDKKDIAGVLAVMQSSFGKTWDGDDNQTAVAMFGFGPEPDFRDVQHVVAGVDQGGLGMPSRDFYLKDGERDKAVRASYSTLITKLLEMGGTSGADATTQAATVLRVETALAKAQMDNVSRRDPHKLDNRYTLAALKQLMPAFDWDAYLHGMGAPAVPLYEVASPEFFKALNGMLVSEDMATWKVYLRWHLVRTAAPVLGDEWRDAQFAFMKTLTGQPKQMPDWRRCTLAVDHNLGEALGQVYVQQVFPPESKARAQQMVKDIETAMGQDIDRVTWMQDSTKKEAHLKLAAVVDKIGYPDKWIDYAALKVVPDNYVEDSERATEFELRREMSFIGKPLDRTRWGMTPPTVNAYEDPQTNTINFPAGILQPVFFDANADDALNYGAEGAVVGHELTHGFDDQGRKFDVNGNLRDWWTASDAKEYDQRGACIAKEYTGPVPGVADVVQDGRLTQGEDTADNGGIYLALAALKADLKRQGKTMEDKDANGLTNLQQFLIAFGTSWCDELRPEAVRTQVMTNPHSLPELRVNNTLANMPEFEQAFGCKAGQPMVHADQCRVW